MRMMGRRVRRQLELRAVSAEAAVLGEEHGPRGAANQPKALPGFALDIPLARQACVGKALGWLAASFSARSARLGPLYGALHNLLLALACDRGRTTSTKFS
jgi:hypothetical protein